MEVIQDLVYNEQFALDAKFHGAFVRDITLVRFQLLFPLFSQYLGKLI